MHYNYQDNLQSERLTTRFLTKDDVKIWSEFLCDNECIQFFPNFGTKTCEERAEFWIDKQLSRYKENRYGLQALIHKETGEFIGQCGLLTQDVDGIIELEVGYHIFKQHWGKGYASEGSQLLKKYAFDNNLCLSLVSIIHVDNARSQKVAEKNGMKRDKRVDFFDTDHYVYRIYK